MGLFGNKEEKKEVKETPKLVCPYCGKVVEEIIGAWTDREERLNGCPHCKKILGVSIAF